MRTIKNIYTVDFETEEIEPRPEYPPRPVGVSIRLPSGKSTYYAWGHPCDNNCTQQQARKILADIWKKENILFYNSKFDLDVAEKHLQLPVPPWYRIHDSMFLAFLYNPHAWSLELKEVAVSVLGMDKAEQEAVRDWLVNNGVVKKNDKKWGRAIAKAPGKLVGKYAIGDTTRTFKLFQKLYKYCKDMGMVESYDRECQIMPILLRNEQQGVRVDINLLERDIQVYTKEFKRIDAYLAKRLAVPRKIDPEELNVDSDAQVAKRLDYLGIVDEWTLTATGKLSMAKKNLSISMFKDKKVALAYAYRNRLQTCMSTFLLPWMETASRTNGIIHTNWNQVRQAKTDGGFAGARTGRLSSNPNFMNIPTSFYEKDDGYEHPKTPTSLIELPLVRRYILPDVGHIFGSRDYDQQELRILAYYEDADLFRAYIENPALDVHTFVQKMLREVGGIDLQRKATKIINFGAIYGMGINKLAERLQIDEGKSREIRMAHREALPGLKQLEKDIKNIGDSGEYITTWGNRIYYAEEGKIINGREQSFSYKLLNYLIQGSAADCTKQSIINYDDIQQANGSEARFLVTVHDENNVSLPKKNTKQEMLWLKEAMEAVDFEGILMASTGKVGPNWADTKNYKVEGDIK